MTETRTYFKDKRTFLREAVKDDHPFIYKLVEDFLKTDLSVTVLKMPSFEDFFKTETKRYTITNESDLIGFVQILPNNEVGYFIDKKYQNSGIGTEAVAILMQINPRERYFATINNKNGSSLKLIEKLGFKPKATIFEKIIS